jgi:hypothetical protein
MTVTTGVALFTEDDGHVSLQTRLPGDGIAGVARVAAAPLNG